MKKVLFRPLENERDKPASPDAVAEDTEVEDSCQVCETFYYLLKRLGAKVFYQKIHAV